MTTASRCCVLIAFKDRRAELHRCLESLLPQLSGGAHILLVDDGSERDIAALPEFAKFLSHSSVHLVRHPENLGVSAARNTGINWAADREFDIVIMTDSDCIVPPDFIEAHLALHRKYPSAPLVGGGIRGTGGTLWAKLDGMMTWFHCFPGLPERKLMRPYVAPTANLSLKIRMLPFGRRFFEDRLHTGEDTAFSRRVLKAGFEGILAPFPEILHADRERFLAFLRHQYEFGRHHYWIVHSDRGMGELCLQPLYRLVTAPLFVLAMPLYAVLGCYLNIRPWLRFDWRNSVYWPLLQCVWLVKGIAFLESAFFRERAFRLGRRPHDGRTTNRRAAIESALRDPADALLPGKKAPRNDAVSR